MLLLLILISLSVFVDIYKIKCPQKTFYWLLVIGLILVSAFRFRIGIDSIRYEDSYSDIPAIFNLSFEDMVSLPYEPLWIVFCSFLRTFSDNFVLLQLVHAVIINWIFCRFLYKNTENKFIALFFYTIAMYFLFNFESIRESLAIAIFLLFWAKWRTKLYLYFLGCMICCLVHYGAAILLFVPLLWKIKLNVFTLWSITFGVILIGMLVSEALSQFSVSFLGSLIEYKYRTYISRDGAFSLYSALIYFVIPFTAFILWIVREKKQHGFHAYLLIYYSLLLCTFFVPIMLRFANYFIIFYIIFLADLLNKLIKLHVATSLRSIWTMGLIMFFAFTYLSWFFIGVTNTNYRNYDKYFPYSSVIFKEISDKREYIKDVEFM